MRILSCKWTLTLIGQCKTMTIKWGVINGHFVLIHPTVCGSCFRMLAVIIVSDDSLFCLLWCVCQCTPLKKMIRFKALFSCLMCLLVWQCFDGLVDWLCTWVFWWVGRLIVQVGVSMGCWVGCAGGCFDGFLGWLCRWVFWWVFGLVVQVGVLMGFGVGCAGGCFDGLLGWLCRWVQRCVLPSPLTRHLMWLLLPVRYGH